MIACSCNCISEQDVKDAVVAIYKAHPDRFITPGAVYRELGHMPNCGGCFPLIAALIRATRAEIDSDETREDVPA